MEGIGTVGHDVGEGLILVLVELALVHLASIIADLPDAQVGGAVGRVERSSDKLKIPVVVKVGHSVIPGVLAAVLHEAADLRMNVIQLFVNVGRLHGNRVDIIGICGDGAGKGNGGQHGQRKQAREKSLHF